MTHHWPPYHLTMHMHIGSLHSPTHSAEVDVGLSVEELSVVERAHAVEGSAVHHAQDDGETGNQEHL